MKKRILITLLSFVILLIGCTKADEELSETVALGIDARLEYTNQSGTGWAYYQPATLELLIAGSQAELAILEELDSSDEDLQQLISHTIDLMATAERALVERRIDVPAWFAARIGYSQALAAIHERSPIILSNQDNLNSLLEVANETIPEADPREKLGLLADDIEQLQQLTEDALTLHRTIELDDGLTATVYHTSETNVDVFVFAMPDEEYASGFTVLNRETADEQKAAFYETILRALAVNIPRESMMFMNRFDQSSDEHQLAVMTYGFDHDIDQDMVTTVYQQLQEANAKQDAASALQQEQNNDEQTQTENKGSSEQRRAIARAESFTNLMAFSRARLIQQLEFEGFTHNDAQWAVDQLTIDWNEQALKKANSYHSLMSLPPDNIRRLLAFEDFSEEQIDYAMTNIGN
ncbi:Ltp family lipoprotein [Enterococcus casseliflavus]|uniref:Ltp family lipoprotein n=1 Tax=Enterococcus casseliflavus TaxID=37734 RepID=UPI0022DEE066|nr:Ltp family lipoprotein [Enterococcus casseliflavus]MEB6087317.1 Ltp family lipoprotein [Enterococcus casseliflavus]